MVELTCKSVCLWHAFNTLAGGNTTVNKSQLKVLTHNIANCLGVQKIEEKLEEHFEKKDITFHSFYAFIKSELFYNLQETDIRNGNVNLEKVDEVCWFVCCCDYVKRNGALLSMDNMFVLWKIFNVIVDYDYEDEMPQIPVLADLEEIDIIGRKFCSILAKSFPEAEFGILCGDLDKFSYTHVLNLWETQLCINLDTKLITNALKELQDEIVYQVLKKGQMTKKGHVVTTWRERWFVLSPNFIKYYSNSVEKDLKGNFPISTACKVENLPDIKGAKPFRFKVHSPGKTLEISASDMRTQNEWVAAINTAIENYQQQKQGKQEMDRKQRHLNREARKQKALELLEEKNRNLQEIATAKAAHKTAEAKAQEEEEARKRTILELEEQKRAREAAEAKSKLGEEKSELEREHLEKTQAQLEAEKQARADAEARLIEEAALREAERQRLEELEALQRQLEQLLQQEREAKHDEEIVRNLQAKVLQEEFEKREELENLKVVLETRLQEEQQRTAGLEEVKQEQEERLKQEQAHLRAEQERLQEMEDNRRLLDQQLQDAETKLVEAETAKLELEANLKSKQREKPVFKLIPEMNLPDDQEFKLITHRGYGAFVEADFQPKLSTSSVSELCDQGDSGLSGENSPLLVRKSCDSEDPAEPENNILNEEED